MKLKRKRKENQSNSHCQSRKIAAWYTLNPAQLPTQLPTLPVPREQNLRAWMLEDTTFNNAKHFSLKNGRRNHLYHGGIWKIPERAPLI